MEEALACIQQNINQLIKNSDTGIFVQVQASIVPKYDKAPSMFKIPAESPPPSSMIISISTTPTAAASGATPESSSLATPSTSLSSSSASYDSTEPSTN